MSDDVPPAAAWQGGWLDGARRCASPNFGARPDATAIDLVVVHSISLPPGEYGGDQVERLFLNRLDPAEHPYFATIAGREVSAHFLVRRSGELLQFVSCDDRAWHAGASSWQGRAGCNDYSIGVEFEGLEGGRFETAQYETFDALLRPLRRRYPIAWLAGHEHVAPGRKLDPGPGFDWWRLRPACSALSIRLPDPTVSTSPPAGSRDDAPRDGAVGIDPSGHTL